MKNLWLKSLLVFSLGILSFLFYAENVSASEYYLTDLNPYNVNTDISTILVATTTSNLANSVAWCESAGKSLARAETIIYLYWNNPDFKDIVDITTARWYWGATSTKYNNTSTPFTYPVRFSNGYIPWKAGASYAMEGTTNFGYSYYAFCVEYLDTQIVIGTEATSTGGGGEGMDPEAQKIIITILLILGTIGIIDFIRRFFAKPNK